MSKRCAEICGLMCHLDQTYKNIAHGVGQSEILGLLHSASIEIGGKFYECSFLVLDSPNIDFLFGLDMLHKHMCVIDLQEKLLRVGFGEVSVSFLQEKDTPSRFLDEGGNKKQASSSGSAETLEATNKRSINVGQHSASVSRFSSPGTSSTYGLCLDPDRSAEADDFLHQILRDSDLRAKLFEIPQLGEFVLGNDLGESLQCCLKKLHCRCRHCETIHYSNKTGSLHSVLQILLMLMLKSILKLPFARKELMRSMELP